jgi:hypothetical protein
VPADKADDTMYYLEYHHAKKTAYSDKKTSCADLASCLFARILFVLNGCLAVSKGCLAVSKGYKKNFYNLSKISLFSLAIFIAVRYNPFYGSKRFVSNDLFHRNFQISQNFLFF